jgi:basic amino acid/polyamine antiporter, APA family
LRRAAISRYVAAMAKEQAATPSHPHTRALGLFSVLCIGVNAIVGSGIFRLPGRLGHYLGGASWIAFAIVGVLLIAVGLCFAEMGGMFDASGGPYVYAREAFGKIAGLVIGWMAWVTMVLSWAAVANAVPGYLAVLVPGTDGPIATRAVVASLIVIPGVLNYFGVRPGAYATNAFTIAKLVPLALFTIVGLPHVDWSRIHALPNFDAGFAPIGAALLVALFPLQGFEVAPVPAGETKNPKRNVPIAVIASLVFCAIFYVLIQIVAYGTEPAIANTPAGADNPGSAQPLADAARSFFGENGARFIAIGACISIMGFCVGSALATPRFLGVLAEDRLFPKWLAELHPRFASPHHAIVFTVIVTLLASQLLDFDSLVDMANVAVTLQYVATCAAVAWLRYRKPDLPRSYKVPGGPFLVPLVGIGVCVLLLSQAAASEWIWSAGTIAIGCVLAAIHHFLRRGRT